MNIISTGIIFSISFHSTEWRRNKIRVIRLNFIYLTWILELNNLVFSYFILFKICVRFSAVMIFYHPVYLYICRFTYIWLDIFHIWLNCSYLHIPSWIQRNHLFRLGYRVTMYIFRLGYRVTMYIFRLEYRVTMYIFRLGYRVTMYI